MRPAGPALAILMPLFLGSCRSGDVETQASIAPAPGPFVRGRIDYRDLVLLPRGSLLRIHLLAFSEDPPEEELLSSWVEIDPGQVPIQFELPYDRDRVDGGDRYRLRAWITRDEQPLYQTTKLVEVALHEDVLRQRAVELALPAIEAAERTAGFPQAPLACALSASGGERDALSGSWKPWVLDVGTLMLTPSQSAPEDRARIPLPESALVRGRLDSVAREPLQPGTKVVVTLVQSPPEGAPEAQREEEVLSTWERDDASELPLDFELTYDPRSVEADWEHSIRARIALGDSLLYLRTELFAVALGAEIERMDGASQLAGAPVAAAPLDVGEVALVAPPRSRAPDPSAVPPAPEAAPPSRGGPAVRGELLHFEPGSLPAGAVMEVRLVATSDVDRSDEELARYERQDPGPSPMPFVLEYDPERVDGAHEYSIRAQIRVGERKLFQTTRLFRVDLWTAVQRGGDARSVEVGRVALTKVPQ